MRLWWVLIKCQCCRLRRKGTRGRSSRGGSRCSCSSRCLFSSGLSMHFGMTLFFIRPCKFTSTDFARKWLLSSVSPENKLNFRNSIWGLEHLKHACVHLSSLPLWFKYTIAQFTLCEWWGGLTYWRSSCKFCTGMASAQCGFGCVV